MVREITETNLRSANAGESQAYVRYKVFAERAKVVVDQKKDLNLQHVHICTVCGYTVEGDAPEKCPIWQRFVRQIHGLLACINALIKGYNNDSD